MTGTTESSPRTEARTVLVTGATGYIGGRLVPRLLEAGHTVKVLVRTPAKIAGVPWLDDVEVVQSSLDDGAALRDALAGVDVLYYLVHSMAAGSGFESKEKAMAETAAKAAADAGVDRIVYLGGLHPRQCGTVHPHAVPRGSGQGVPGQPGGRGGLPGRRGDRLRVCVLRNDPAPLRNPPADAGAELGAQQDRGDRRPGRAVLPGRRRVPRRDPSTAPSISAAARS